MKKALMVSGNFPCVRVGKTTEALSYRGWEHDVLCMKEPPQMRDVYKRIKVIPSATNKEFGEMMDKHDGELLHVHNEPNWPVMIAKEYTDKPVIMNVHDVASARPKASQFRDIFEFASYEAADGLIFVTDEQRDFVIARGANIKETPYAVVGNYATSRYFLDKPILPHVGGLVYEGGLDARGKELAWRDQSVLADALEKSGVHMHIFSDERVDYGVPHGPVVEFVALIHRLSQYDWGFCGTMKPIPAWEHSIPNKFFDYLSAGIPVIVMNCPELKPLCDEGFGIYVYDHRDAVNIVKNVDPKPYKKYVAKHRQRFTMLNHIQPVVDLYDEVLRGK